MRRFVFALSLALAGCDSCSAKTAPASAATVEPNVRVTVERPGKPAFTLDGAVLAKRPADLGEPPWLAWKLKNVVPDWDDRAPVDVIDDEGIRSPLLRPGESSGNLESVLLVGNQGESRVIRLTPGAAITAHRGESRKDAGRIRHVTSLSSSTAMRASRARRSPSRSS